MARRSSEDRYPKQSFRRTAIKIDSCPTCKGWGWGWKKIEGITYRSATVHYKVMCNKCVGKGTK